MKTPLLEYIEQRKAEKLRIKEERREERRKKEFKEFERKKPRDDGRRRRREGVGGGGKKRDDYWEDIPVDRYMDRNKPVSYSFESWQQALIETIVCIEVFYIGADITLELSSSLSTKILKFLCF